MTKTILITGATSGIGKALALNYAKDKNILLLTGRNEARLNQVKEECEKLGSTVEAKIIDVANAEKMKEAITSWHEAHLIDIAIANAGISGGTSIHKINQQDQFDDVIRINIEGTFNTINPLIPLMIERKKGQVVLLSSMAGFRGMPTAPAYSISKVTVKAYGDAIRSLLKKHNVYVSTIFPGFIKTPMTEVNNFEMPLLLEANEAAEIIRKGIDNKKAYIAFPLPMYVISRVLTMLPRAIYDYVLGRMPNK